MATIVRVDAESKLEELLRKNDSGLPGLEILRVLEKEGVARADASRAIAHGVSRGQLTLDERNTLTLSGAD
jgi:hypothetical protein